MLNFKEPRRLISSNIHLNPQKIVNENDATATKRSKFEFLKNDPFEFPSFTAMMGKLRFYFILFLHYLFTYFFY